ncbi:GGDEF domain-containing protein [Leucothrix sargassi]|nr:GGDEF domain-containing protein [Leucothrix sargassi]
MKFSQQSKMSNLLLTALGPLLIICIIISGSYIVSMYKSVMYSKQKTLWSVMQLDRELAQTRSEVKDYIHGITTAESLEMAYNILWSRIPIAVDSLRNDLSLSELDDTEIDLLISGLFDDLKRMEPIIVGQNPIDKEALREWSDVLKQHDEAIRGNLIHDLASSNSRYMRQTTALFLKAATIPLFFIICFFLYLAYLLSALWDERKTKQKMLDHDSMTGLHSRDFIMNTLENFSKLSSPYTLLAFDLNKFKKVNDTLGHNAGDKLLQYFALQLKNTLGQHGTVGRVGGDEFLCVFESDDQESINDYYEAFLLALKKPLLIGGEAIQVSVSTGGVVSSQCNNHVACVLEQADIAMYEAKRQQRQTISWRNQDRKFSKKILAAATRPALASD